MSETATVERVRQVLTDELAKMKAIADNLDRMIDEARNLKDTAESAIWHIESALEDLKDIT